MIKFFFILLTGIVVAASSQAALPEAMIHKLQPDARPLSPNDAVVMALGDVSGLPAEIRSDARYLSLHNIPAAERAEFCQVLDFCLNSLSRSRVMAWCVPVAGSNGSVVRVMLDSYSLTSDGWDTLAAKGSGPVRVAKKVDQPEEWFGSTSTTRTRKVTKQRQQRNAKGELLFFDVGKPTEKPAMESYEEEIVERIGAAPWLDPVSYASLQSSTHSTYPILLGQWFVANAMISPAYNELMGFKTLKDFQAFTRFSELGSDMALKGVVTNSLEVALHQRAIKITPTVLGFYNESFDYFDSKGEDNLLKDLLKNRRDAGEIIGTTRNGLLAYLLVNGKNEVIDFADPQVATDQQTTWRNKLVWSGISCMTCHTEGLKTVTDEVRRLTRPPLSLQIPGTEKKKAEETRDLFFSGGVEVPVDATKRFYNDRVMAATRGLSSQKLSQLLQKNFVSYWQDTITLEDAARYVGSTADELRPLIGGLKEPPPDPALTQLLAGLPVRKDMFLDGAYQQLATIAYTMRKGKQ